MKVLFVCYGNICRSPMGEAMLKDMAQKQNLNIIVDSAGTHVYQGGSQPYPKTKEILDELNINYEGMYSRAITHNDFKDFDLILGMDGDNVRNLMKKSPQEYRHKIHLFLDILEDKKGQSVPDPYYTRDFEETKNLLSEGLVGWIHYINQM